MPTVAFYSLGCKLNQAENELLAREFTGAGYKQANGDAADICILNTCTVTHIADRKSRRMLRSLRKQNPDALVVATGCYVDESHKDLSGLGVDLVIDNDNKTRLLQLVQEKRPVKQVGSPVTSSNANRVRSFVKIQEGCDGYCAYCIVPQARGREHSVPLSQVLQEITARTADGFKEVVLTGTKIGAYCEGGSDLKDLIAKILDLTTIERLHLSSLQPQEITKDLLELWDDRRLNRHFHIALQSGSETVLTRMRRRYSLADFEQALSEIRKTIPGIALTTDVLVGFPGETDLEFNECYSFCREAGFARIHVFPYSPRPGTVAARMQGQISSVVKKERTSKMLALARESSRAFHKQVIGQEVIVLWESKVDSTKDIYSGLTDTYIRVFTKGHRDLMNRLTRVRLVSLYKDGLWGEVIG
jgi:threonylcarbamoyladenosine tRNA methylthiotransferase MtaB